MTSTGRREQGLDHIPRDFDIEFDVHDRVLKPHGELDLLTSPILLAAAKAFTWEIPGDMTVDLGAVTFGDSALLNALIDIRLDQHEVGHTMKITNMTTPIKRLFLLSGFRPSA